MSRETPLICKIVDGVLQISVGVETIAFAARNLESVMVFDDDMLDYVAPQIENADAFAKYVLDELEAEEEDGTTLVHILLDKAIEKAFENGPEGVRLAEDIIEDRKKILKARGEKE